MITTILAVVALSGSLAPAAKPEFQAQTDYGQALKRAADEKKPMAVLIGKGDVFAKMMTDAGLSADAKKLLTEKYVCVAVNVETDAGKALAGQFQLTDGLVISSAGGTHQALRQSGAVSATDLAKHTATYANVTSAPATTATAGTPVVTSTSFYAAPTRPPPAASAEPAGYSPSAAAPTARAADRPITARRVSSCAGGSCGTSTAPPVGRRGFRR